jgi:hypothetical protein
MTRFSYLFPEIDVKELIKGEKEFIKDLNREQMYEEGVMNVERPKKLDYAPGTIRQKKKTAKYKKTDFITLRWMGDFYKSLKVLVFDKWFTVSSDSTIWARFLEPQDRFEKALGLTDKSKDKLKDRLRDKAIQWLKTHR